MLDGTQKRLKAAQVHVAIVSTLAYKNHIKNLLYVALERIIADMLYSCNQKYVKYFYAGVPCIVHTMPHHPRCLKKFANVLYREYDQQHILKNSMPVRNCLTLIVHENNDRAS